MEDGGYEAMGAQEYCCGWVTRRKSRKGGENKVLLPFGTIPYLFISYFGYYTADSGSEKDAFILPFSIWYDVMTIDHNIVLIASNNKSIFHSFSKDNLWLENTIDIHFRVYLSIKCLGVHGWCSYDFDIAFIWIMLAIYGICWWYHCRCCRSERIQTKEWVWHSTLGTAVWIYPISFRNKAVESSISSSMCFTSNMAIILTFTFRLLGKFGDTYSWIFTSNLLWTIPTLAVQLLTMQMELVRHFLDWFFQISIFQCTLKFVNCFFWPIKI